MRSKGVSYKHRKGERVRCRGHAQRLGVHCMAPVSQGLCTSTYSVSFFRLKAFIIQTYSFLIIYNLPFCALLQDILTNYLSSWAILEVRARGVGSHAGWGGEKWAKEQSQGNRQGSIIRAMSGAHPRSQSAVQNAEVRTPVYQLGKSRHSQEICLAGDKELIQSC